MESDVGFENSKLNLHFCTATINKNIFDNFWRFERETNKGVASGLGACERCRVD
jgi:hypothetical protein